MGSLERMLGVRLSEADHQKKRLGPIIRKWLNRTGLNGWTVDIEYYDRIPRHEDAAMAMDVQWVYLQATMKVSTNKVADETDRRCEEIIVHELAHILVNEMRPLHRGDNLDDYASAQQMEHEERVCTMIARALLWTYESK